MLVHCKCVYLIIGGLKDHLGMPREGVWAVSLCLTQVSRRLAFSERIACYKVSKMKLKNYTVTMI